jgi:hypothetical protein
VALPVADFSGATANTILSRVDRQFHLLAAVSHHCIATHALHNSCHGPKRNKAQYSRGDSGRQLQNK